jgi:hypothetical protein
MVTLTLSGRYNVGVTIYLRPVSSGWEQVLRGERRTMDEAKAAMLTVARCVSVARATNARQALSEASDGDVGLGEISTFEVLS